MIKIAPKVAVTPPKKPTKPLPKQPKFDLSGEEKGFFKVGDRVVKIVFPR